MSTSRSKLSPCCSSSGSEDAGDDAADGRASMDKMEDVLERRVFLTNDAAPPSPHLIALEEAEHRKKQAFDMNRYASKKTAANGLLDLALLMANASQLKHILVQGSANDFYYVMLTLILTSIVLQVFVGLALLYLVRVHVTEDETDIAGTARSRRADSINNWIVAAIFLLTVINIFIAAFGLEQVDRHPSPDTVVVSTLPVKQS
uniref:Ninjurin 2 n=1 Tax=Plectus sambesii TaxID=2011161 RepID=A0A914WD58_9BILA